MLFREYCGLRVEYRGLHILLDVCDTCRQVMHVAALLHPSAQYLHYTVPLISRLAPARHRRLAPARHRRLRSMAYCTRDTNLTDHSRS